MTLTEPRRTATAPPGAGPGTGPGTGPRPRLLLALRAWPLLLALGDLLLLAAGLSTAWALDADVSTATAFAPTVSLVGLAWLAVLVSRGAYARRVLGAGPEEFRAVALGSLITAGGVGMALFLADSPLSRLFVVLSLVLGTVLLLAGRYAARKVVHRLRRQGRLLHRVVAVGGPSGIAEVVGTLQRNHYLGYGVVGVCTPSGTAEGVDTSRTTVLGRVDDLVEVCRAEGADTVLVTRGGFSSSAELRRIGWALEGSDIDLVVVPSLTDIAGPRIHLRPVAGLPLMHVEQPQAASASGLSKRGFDAAFAAFALLVLSPVLLVVAVAVKLHDGGPVLFRQQRIGRDGRPFSMVKFRSMVVDAEQRLADLQALNESDGALFKIRRDPRITPVGRLLRRYSLDELPQLVNVLRGDMSLVGPRPPLPSEVDRYAADVHRRLLVRPGLTGLWQVSGRSSLSWEESVRLDLYYVDNWSMTTDLVIIAKTVRAVVSGSGAF